jgi:hypothetical protein
MKTLNTTEFDQIALQARIPENKRMVLWRSDQTGNDKLSHRPI